MEVNFGGTALEGNKYANLRSEMWDKVKEWIEAGGAIPSTPDLKSDLAAPTYSFDARGKFVLEPKEKLKARGLRSPDLADALALTFAAPVAARQAEDEIIEDLRERASGKDRYDVFSWRKGR
jgi:hypothetical protein